MKLIAILGAAMMCVVSASWASETTKIDIVNPAGQGWQFHRVSVTGNILTGRLNAPVTSARPPQGHVDVTAYGPDQQPIVKLVSAPHPSVLSPRWHKKGGVRFSATLPDNLPAGSVIRLAFHPDPSLHVDNR